MHFSPKIRIGHYYMNMMDPIFWLFALIVTAVVILVALLIAGRKL